jgi:putative transcriptional regulator
MTAVERLAGHLLIAGPALWDPNFRRTVVLVGHHDDEGAVGVVLNRASEVSVTDAAPPLGALVEPDAPLFIGGPVQPEAAVVLADFEHPEMARVIAFGSIGFLPDEMDAEEGEGVRRARVFAGHAGWGPGQLEAELEQGSWIVEPANEADVFTPEPARLWERVLRRKGHRFDLLRTMPVDPASN